MQRTLALTGVAIAVAATIGLAVAMERLPRGWKRGAMWNDTARRVKAFLGRAQHPLEGIEWPTPW